MVLGEAPGATENERGEPFCGASGRVLDQLMALAGLGAREWLEGGAIRREANAWLTNVVKYRPPGNRTPTFKEIESAQPYLRHEWNLVGRPPLIVCVGSVAAAALGVHTPSRITRGHLYPLKDGKTYVSYQFHPAYGLRGGTDRQQQMELQWEVMGNIMEELGWDTNRFPTVS